MNNNEYMTLIVLVKRIKNNYYGNPRYNITILYKQYCYGYRRYLNITKEIFNGFFCKDNTKNYMSYNIEDEVYLKINRKMDYLKEKYELLDNCILNIEYIELD